ncbi:MAG: hypothetical protein ACP5HJ_00650 [Candidatus Micrarchaeia archaeon]|jgi:hypothetical protein
MKRVEVFLIVITLIYSIFLFSILSTFGINFFLQPKNKEIYFLNFNESNFSIFSNEYQYCFINNKKVLLEYGVNNFPSQQNVFVNCSNTTIWFNLQKVNESKVYLKNYSINIVDSKVAVSLKGNSGIFGLYKIPIFLNGKEKDILHYFYPGNFSIYKEFQIDSNKINVSVDFFGNRIEKNLVLTTRYPIVFLLCFLLVLVFSLIFFEKEEAFVLITFFTILYFHFLYSLPQNFQALLFLILLFSICVILKKRIIKRRETKIKEAKGRIKSRFQKREILMALFFTLFIFLIKIAIGYSSVWGYYYSRMAEETFLHSTPFFFDNLSYLGRNFIYPYGYFDFSAGIARLLNIDYLILEPFIHAFLLFLFVYSLILLFEKITNNFVGAFLMLSQTFLFITSIISPLHVFSLLFLTISILFFIQNKKVFSILSLSVSFITHSLSIFFFPFFLIPIFKKEKIKEYLEIIFASLLIAFPFYINFLKLNLTVSAPFSLGLLQPTPGIFTENLFLIVLLFFSLLVSFLTNSFKKENTLALSIFLLNILLYRINIASVFIICYVSYITLSRFISKKIFLLFIFLNLFFASLIYSGIRTPCAWGVASKVCIAPMLYINNFSYSNISTPGFFGHLETFFGKQPVLSDYYVEYSKPQNFYAQEEFCKTGNFSYIKNFKIKIIVNSNYFCSSLSNSSTFQKVYSNGYFDVFLAKINRENE